MAADFAERLAGRWMAMKMVIVISVMIRIALMENHNDKNAKLNIYEE